TLTLQEEKELIIKFFKEEFVDILKGSPDRQNAINLRIFYVLSKDGNFNKELETALYNNKQKATHKTFKLDNNSKTPSVGNWLRYFIKENSTANFNEITLLKFLLNSPNTKILDSNERELLNTILKTYRNIKFFPESMPSDTNIKWEIIPIIRTALISERKLEEGLTKIPKKKLGVPGEAPKEIIEEEQNENEAVTEGIQDILAAEDNLKESEVEEAVVKDESTIPRSIESLIDKPTPPIAPEIEDTLEEEEEESAIEIPITIKEPVAINKPGMDEIATEEIIKEEPIIEVIPKKPKVIVPPVIEKPKNKNPRTKELEDMAAMYPKGSMERKAIEEEIKKLEI
ncbi:hypothetical protein ISS03_03175, partial [Patescibacteria group bacterium]|nr:hypothetical protein [Patescibacteria group bacterium]